MNDRQGLPGKTGLDDLLFRVGPDQFRCFMADALDKTRSKCVSLGDVRRQMGLARLESLSVPGVYVDTSPPGTGKTQAGRAAMSAAGTSLTVLPTHRNCREFCRDLNRAGLTAEPYPQLTQGKGDVESPDYEPATCENYSEAAEALGYGLSPSVVICPTCTHGPAGSQSCEYQAQMKAAQDASHAVAPHKRASLGFATLARGRKCITIDEDATDIIRPTVSVGASFEVIIRLAAAIGARYAGRNNDTGRYAAWGFEDAARFLETSLSLTTVTQPLAMPEAVGLPHDFDRTTFVTIRESGLRPDPDAWKVCRAVVGGELAELTVRCDQVFSRGAEKKIHKAIMAVWKTQLPRGKTVWLNDATADIDALEHLIGLPIIDSTPRGVVQQLHQVTQYAADITRGTSPAVVLKILRAALAAYPAYRRIGVICHRPHAGTIRGTGKNEHRLAEAEQQRIVKVEYFKSGEGRGSN